jgi:outer membrane receptor protein involved in Fe transport
MVLAPVEDFSTGRIDRDKPEWVKRFHDMYHNEALVARFGFKDKEWADRLMFNMTYSQNYKDMQTGVRQDIVYGEKHRKSHSLMPGVEYVKRGAFGMGLDIMARANYNHNVTTNIDTAQYKYNWRGEKQKLNSPGEQSRQHSQAINSNFNTVLNLNYRFWRIHSITLNNALNAFWRRKASLLAGDMTEEAIGKHTMKNILGAQYRVFPSEKWNMVAFAKWYHQSVSGPMATDANATSYVEYARGLDNLGYGIAATWFPLKGLQAKVSYEKAIRLPTIEEMFGDEDLEMGSVDIRPEKSHNLNVNLSYTLARRKHNLLLEGGFVFRDMNDYIQRNVVDLSGGKQAAAYTNYGKVRVMGWNLSARYGYSRWLSLGGNLTYNDVRDNMPTALGTTMPNISYGERMPNQPYLFADADIALTWNNCLAKGNSLTLQYENMYVHSFSYYSNHIGSGNSEYLVPMQFSHNIVLTYAMKGGRYNLSFECRNLTNALLYDNFRLQKPGRAFFGKVLIRI